MTTSTTDAIDEIRPAVRHQLGSKYICRPMGEKVGIVTPFLLPDGHNIQLLLRDTPQGAMLYDDDNIDQWFAANFVDGLALLDGMGDAVYARAAAAYGVAYQDGAAVRCGCGRPPAGRCRAPAGASGGDGVPGGRRLGGWGRCRHQFAGKGRHCHPRPGVLNGDGAQAAGGVHFQQGILVQIARIIHCGGQGRLTQCGSPAYAVFCLTWTIPRTIMLAGAARAGTVQKRKEDKMAIEVLGVDLRVASNLVVEIEESVTLSDAPSALWRDAFRGELQTAGIPDVTVVEKHSVSENDIFTWETGY